MRTQITERNNLHRAIDALSDAAISQLTPYVEFLESRDDSISGAMPDETREALEELRAGRGNKASGINELMAALHED
jgi:hypothetical protein